MTMTTPNVAKPLSQPFAQVTLDGSGNGIASLGPVKVREHWQLISASVKTTQLPSAIVNDATCQLYIGSNINQGTFVSKTITGSSGDTCPLASQDIQPGMQVWAQWIGGDAGATAVLTLTGTYTTGSPS